MDTLWQKIKLWTKIVVLALLVIHAGLFVLFNMGAVVSERLSLVYVSYDRPSFLLVMLLTSILSIFGWWVFWMVVRALRQLRQAGERGRLHRLERETADLKAKAAMLQSRQSGPGVIGPTDAGGGESR